MFRSVRIPSVVFVVFLCLGSVSAVCAAQAAAAKVDAALMASINRQVGWDDALPGERNPTGLQMRFAKIDEVAAAEGHTVRYRAYVLGASEKKTYAMGTWRIGSDVQILPVDVYVNAKGLLMVHKPRPEQENSESVADDDELDLAMQAAKGEPVRFVLATADGKFMVPGTIVPFPIESKGASCRIELRLAAQDGRAVLIYGDGFSPNAEVPLQMASAGDVEQGKFSVNAAGHAVTTDLPFVDGKNSGVLKVAVDAKGCSVSAAIPWGEGSYHLF
jgi:hypothetical protein